MADILYNWTPDSMMEVILPTPDSFLKIKETLTRIGIASKKEKKLYQSVNLLHKQGRYYLVHFKELFILDNKDSNISVGDIDRRNAIALLLEEWGLLKVVNRPNTNARDVLSQIKILSYKEKGDWILCPKYTVGKKKPSTGRKQDSVSMVSDTAFDL